MEMKYDFEAQLKKGNEGEKSLDAFFSPDYEIKQATAAEQRSGIDRWFTRKETGKRYAIEYKTDYRAGQTHNAFIETVSVDSKGKAGWAETLKADFIVYFIPDLELIYLLKPSRIQSNLPKWKAEFKEREIPNRGYCTKGICVPLAEIERIAAEVIQTGRI